MFFINLIKKYLVDSQLWVSLMGTCLSLFFMLEQKIFRFPTLLLIFITFLSGYLYTKFQSSRTKLYKILFLNIVCGIASLFLIYHNHNEIRIVKWSVIVVLGFLYNSFFLEKFVRKIPLVKIFYVGLVWGLVNGWLIIPSFDWGNFLISFIYISALVLPFDIRDMQNDTITTFPRLVGIEKTKYLFYGFLSISILIAVYFLTPLYAAAFYLSCLVSGILMYFSHPDKPYLYYALGVEMCCGLPLFFLILLK